MKKISKIGVIGGLGPLASASFVETLYTQYIHNENLKNSYHYPYIYLYSEPLLTQASEVMSISDCSEELLRKLNKCIANLLEQDIEHILICCFTAHIMLPKLPSQYQTKIHSLVTLVLEHVGALDKKFVFFSASSARDIQILQTHPLWDGALSKIIFVQDSEQQKLNELIKTVKNSQITLNTIKDFLALFYTYQTYCIIIACAELHMLCKALRTHTQSFHPDIFDPFCQITNKLWGANA